MHPHSALIAERVKQWHWSTPGDRCMLDPTFHRLENLFSKEGETLELVQKSCVLLV